MPSLKLCIATAVYSCALTLFASGLGAQTVPEFAPPTAPSSRSNASSTAPTSLVPPAVLSLAPQSTAPSTDDELLERPLFACACGCGIFEVGTATMLPHGAGGMLYLEYDYQDQSINWSGVHPSPGYANPDKELRTHFVTLGLQYFFDRNWGVQIELPYDNRTFKTTGGPSGSDTVSPQWSAFGDLRLQGIYAGFFDDQSLGVSFGVKVPTGNYHHSDGYDDVDRDSELGTGCVDLLAGAFFRHQFSRNLTGFVQIALDAPVDQVEGYRPGIEADASIGAYFTGLKFHGLSITPVAELLISERGHDTGPAANHPIASGYQRLLLAPGLEFNFHPFSIYADIEVPFYQHFSGEQLTAPFLLKVILTYNF